MEMIIALTWGVCEDGDNIYKKLRELHVANVQQMWWWWCVCVCVIIIVIIIIIAGRIRIQPSDLTFSMLFGALWGFPPVILCVGYCF